MRARVIFVALLLLTIICVAAISSRGSSEQAGPSAAPISEPLNAKQAKHLARSSVPGAFWLGAPRKGERLRASLSATAISLGYLSARDRKQIGSDPYAYTSLISSEAVSPTEIEALEEKLRDGEWHQAGRAAGARAYAAGKRGPTNTWILLGKRSVARLLSARLLRADAAERLLDRVQPVD